MNEAYRLYIYAFLSRAMSDIPDRKFIADLRANVDLLETIGEATREWFAAHDDAAIYEALNGDYTSMFVVNTQPVESFVLDAKNESLVGLQNPVMAFYFNHGFEVDMNRTELIAPDHLGIEFAFMQTLVYREERPPQLEFLDAHLLNWTVPYMLGMKSMAQTPFYKDLCDFIAEFLVADYAHLSRGGDDGAA